MWRLIRSHALHQRHLHGDTNGSKTLREVKKPLTSVNFLAFCAWNQTLWRVLILLLGVDSRRTFAT